MWPLLLLQYNINYYYYHCSVVKGTAVLVCLWMARLRIHNSKISEISRKARALTYFPSTSSGFSSMNHCFHQAGAVRVTQNSRCGSCFACKGWRVSAAKSLPQEQEHFHTLLGTEDARRSTIWFTRQVTWWSVLQKSLFMSENSSCFSPLHNAVLCINFCFHFSLSSTHQLVCQLERKNIDTLLPYRNSTAAIMEDINCDCALLDSFVHSMCHRLMLQRRILLILFFTC